jgi:hypothetical protein
VQNGFDFAADLHVVDARLGRAGGYSAGNPVTLASCWLLTHMCTPS